jgi:O-acetyl-ADP-ribose deacetylase (regulator of RNase III)
MHEEGDMVITEMTGNLLASDADAIVNTVNTVGVMGKGIALQFRRAYPDMFADYKRAAQAGEIRLGHMHVWSTGALEGPKYIINFPTKEHWRARSTTKGIKLGLSDLVSVVAELDVRSIAVPPLGCGNGGLNWDDVRPMIEEAFHGARGVEVVLYPPKGAPVAAQMPVATAVPKMTPGRAALIEILRRYQDAALSVSLIEIQKLMYFLQEAGEPLRLRYVKGRYGPYADNLRHVLAAVEGHYLSGYGDGSAQVLNAEPLVALPSGIDAAHDELKEKPETVARIDRVLELADGFESAYGMELLASAHWAATHGEGDITRESVVSTVRSWNERKQRMFTAAHINTAIDALTAADWLEAV